MRKHKIHIIHQIFVWVFCFGILMQNGIEAPVICFESDGHINIEAGCNSICAVPIQKTDEHYDDCDNCFDIHFWKYNPDLSFLIHTNNFNLGDLIFNFTISSFAIFQNPHFNDIHVGFFLDPIPHTLKTTILLI